MKTKLTNMASKSFSLAIATGLALLAQGPLTYAQAPDSSAAPPEPAAELPTGSELLTQGPVHEAFAKPVPTDPQAPLVISQAPPAVLQEMPPSEKPAGANIVWVPGYWAWDEARNDFIWISGCWRNAPPNTYWVPGHWLQLDTGWEWISGFWKPLAAQGQQEIEYLPAPPPAFEVEAVGTSPTPDQIWVPGCWYWSEGHYIERHGYWIAPQIGWVWVPSHFAWTPRGYIFCSGHWDHDFDNRGVLFSPVFFPAPVRVQVGFIFSPGLCVDLGMLRLNLFVNPRYNHYCFGDYYDTSYQRAGIYPWYQCQTIHTWYDPLFVYDKWHFERTDPGWAKRQAQQFKQLQASRDLRPAHTYRELQAQFNRLPASKRPERPLAEPIRTYAAAQSTPVKFERISASERQKFTARTTEVSSLRNERATWEAPARATTRPPQQTPKPAQQPPPRETAPSRGSPPRPAVRVTKPEREVVKSPVIAPKPSESRYIEKASPGQQPSENPREARGGGNSKTR